MERQRLDDKHSFIHRAIWRRAVAVPFWLSGCPIFIFAIPRRASRRTYAGNIATRAPSILPRPLPIPPTKGSLKPYSLFQAAFWHGGKSLNRP
ncbi:hypothetical protein [Kingella oralis]|jgi:hypothetical protein|uniref:hypothetical protein n=1 Tax=Kingella oralis TaxID=505 RepID=UPI002D7F8FA2|nr:hypothetical protein [Kingella oralis]